MRHFLLSLVIVLTCSSMCYAQKYQGSVSVGATVMGFNTNTSHGVRFDKDYIGLGTEAGIWTMLFLSREWYSAYADYQHYFPIGPKSSIYLQASPGACWTEFAVIGDSKDSDDPERMPEVGIRACAKLGVGIDWQWEKLGLGLSFQNNFFAPRISPEVKEAEAYWIPSLQLTLHW